MQDLEEDPTLRSQINLYKDTEAMASQADRQARRVQQQAQEQMHRRQQVAGAAAAAAAAEEDDDDDDDDDFPDVELNELLDELTLEAEDEDDSDGGEGEGEGDVPSSQSSVPPVSFAPSDALQTPGINEPVQPFQLPEGNSNVKFHF